MLASICLGVCGSKSSLTPFVARLGERRRESDRARKHKTMLLTHFKNCMCEVQKIPPSPRTSPVPFFVKEKNNRNPKCYRVSTKHNMVFEKQKL